MSVVVPAKVAERSAPWPIRHWVAERGSRFLRQPLSQAGDANSQRVSRWVHRVDSGGAEAFILSLKIIQAWEISHRDQRDTNLLVTQGAAQRPS